MQFGYFTLSDNSYRDNTRPANQFVADIIDEATSWTWSRLQPGAALYAASKIGCEGMISAPHIRSSWRRSAEVFSGITQISL